MGGRGSGRRWHFSAHETTDDYRHLDVRRWQRDGLLVPGQRFDWQWKRSGEVAAWIQVRTANDCMILSYRHRSGGTDWKSEEYPVQLHWTPCTYGGKRAWFVCPGSGCGRRVAILYGGAIFACRHCYRLAYASQRENIDDRAARQAEKIRERLGWEPGILNGEGGKPKGMHWATFERLVDRHELLVEASLSGMMQRFGIGSDEGI